MGFISLKNHKRAFTETILYDKTGCIFFHDFFSTNPGAKFIINNSFLCFLVTTIMLIQILPSGPDRSTEIDRQGCRFQVDKREYF